MRTDLLDILCCPVCKGTLRFVETKRKGEEVLEGTLTCTKCAAVYPIEDGIPDLLPPDERD